MSREMYGGMNPLSRDTGRTDGEARRKGDRGREGGSQGWSDGGSE
jgi:hypothetical protein